MLWQRAEKARNLGMGREKGRKLESKERGGCEEKMGVESGRWLRIA